MMETMVITKAKENKIWIIPTQSIVFSILCSSAEDPYITIYFKTGTYEYGSGHGSIIKIKNPEKVYITTEGIKYDNSQQIRGSK